VWCMLTTSWDGVLMQCTRACGVVDTRRHRKAFSALKQNGVAGGSSGEHIGRFSLWSAAGGCLIRWDRTCVCFCLVYGSTAGVTCLALLPPPARPSAPAPERASANPSLGPGRHARHIIPSSLNSHFVSKKTERNTEGYASVCIRRHRAVVLPPVIKGQSTTASNTCQALPESVPLPQPSGTTNLMYRLPAASGAAMGGGVPDDKVWQALLATSSTCISNPRCLI
jgi:hypothetical protein